MFLKVYGPAILLGAGIEAPLHLGVVCRWLSLSYVKLCSSEIESPLQYCTFPFLPNTDRSRADANSPISVFFVWTVGCDRAQYKAAAVWFEKLMPWQMRGARPGGMTLDVASLVELTLEYCRLFGIRVFGYFGERKML